MLIYKLEDIMNKKIQKALSGNMSKYKNEVGHVLGSNTAIFKIFDTFFGTLKGNDKLQKETGIHMIASIKDSQLRTSYEIEDSSLASNGVAFLFTFDGVKYTIRFTKFREQDRMVYRINIKTNEGTKYTGKFMYKYLLHNALESSNLKGSYFTMPRNQYSWEIKEIENRGFDDIFLPEKITQDLQLFVDIYKTQGRMLRYLKVGNPGAGKTEATLVIGKALNLEGVTIIKTPICERLHDKVELANVLAPSIIIFDDIDLSLGDRNKGAYSQLLGDFLDVLDGTDKMGKNVGVIATTNAAHLLDLAAQRPGRFDKTLLFNDITKENVNDIIKKSLRLNFNITKGKEFKIYSDPKVVNKFYDAGVSGAHVYNTIEMLKLRYDTLQLKVTVQTIVDSIESELEVIREVRKVSFLKEKYERESGGIGFKSRGEDDESVPQEDRSDLMEEQSIKVTEDESVNRPYH